MPRSAIVTLVACSLLSALAPAARAGVIVDPPEDSQIRAAANPGLHIPDPVPVTGAVVSSRSYWHGSRIVTESVIRTDQGDEVRVRQPGGAVDDIGQVQFPSPALLRAGDWVSLYVDGNRSDRPRTIVDIETLERATKEGPAPADTQVQKYVRTSNDHLLPLYWENSCIEITYHPNGTTHLEGELEFQVMDQVFETWRSVTQSCSYLSFAMQGKRDIEAGLDRANVIIFREDYWGRPGCADDTDFCHPPGAAAVTTVSFVNSDRQTSDRAGEIVDADIEFNAVAFDIGHQGQSTSTNGCISDLANTLTHEVGHMMGLEHTCFITLPRDTQGNPKPLPEDDEGNVVGFCRADDPDELKQTTMYPTQECGETSKTSPEMDDIDAICGIYPTAADPGECRPPGSLTRRACACDTGADPANSQLPGALLLLGLAGLYLTRRRRSTRPSRAIIG